MRSPCSSPRSTSCDGGEITEGKGVEFIDNLFNTARDPFVPALVPALHLRLSTADTRIPPFFPSKTEESKGTRQALREASKTSSSHHPSAPSSASAIDPMGRVQRAQGIEQLGCSVSSGFRLVSKTCGHGSSRWAYAGNRNPTRKNQHPHLDLYRCSG